MPYKIIPTDKAFKVVNAQTGQVHAKNTSHAMAERQVKLLYGIEHGLKPAKRAHSYHKHGHDMAAFDRHALPGKY